MLETYYVKLGPSFATVTHKFYAIQPISSKLRASFAS